MNEQLLDHIITYLNAIPRSPPGWATSNTRPIATRLGITPAQFRKAVDFLGYRRDGDEIHVTGRRIKHPRDREERALMVRQDREEALKLALYGKV